MPAGTGILPEQTRPGMMEAVGLPWPAFRIQLRRGRRSIRPGSPAPRFWCPPCAPPASPSPPWPSCGSSSDCTSFWRDSLTSAIPTGRARAFARRPSVRSPIGIARPFHRPVTGGRRSARWTADPPPTPPRPGRRASSVHGGSCSPSARSSCPSMLRPTRPPKRAWPKREMNSPAGSPRSNPISPPTGSRRRGFPPWSESRGRRRSRSSASG